MAFGARSWRPAIDGRARPPGRHRSASSAACLGRPRLARACRVESVHAGSPGRPATTRELWRDSGLLGRACGLDPCPAAAWAGASGGMVSITEPEVGCTSRLEGKGLFIKTNRLTEVAAARPRARSARSHDSPALPDLDLAFQIAIEPRVELDQATAFRMETIPLRLCRVFRAHELHPRSSSSSASGNLPS